MKASLILAHVYSMVNPSGEENRRFRLAHSRAIPALIAPACKGYWNPLAREYLAGAAGPGDTVSGDRSPSPLMERALEQWKSKEVARLLALVETERRYYQEMVANLPLSVAVISQEGNLLAANRAFRQMYEIRGDDIRKRSIQQIFPNAELQARIQSALESGIGSRPLVIDRQVPGSSAQRLRISVQSIRDWDEDSGLQALLVVEDLTDFQHEPALAAVELIEKAPIEPATIEKAAIQPVPVAPFPELLPCVIWTAQAAGRAFTFVSPSAKSRLAIDPEEWMANPNFFIDRIASEDRAGTMAFYDQALNSPGLHSCDFRMRLPGVWYRETILVEHGSDRITGVITDITDRRAIEEQTLQSQRLDAITQLAGRIAHDINNPLMIVNGFAEDLIGGMPPSDARAADMREIQIAGKRIAELTGHLQAVTRKQGEQTTLPVDADAELVKVVQRMHAAAGEYLKADYMPSQHPLAVIAEASQLEAILLELSAALVEGGGESAHLTLSASPYRVVELVRPDQPLAPGEYVELSIVNRSPASRHLPARIFEALIPGKEPGREAGPALARAFKTIQEWGGTILTVPHNNEIRVYLKPAGKLPPDLRPASDSVPTLAAGPTTASPVIAPVVVEFASKSSILIVEDEPGIRALMRKILQREGFEVFEAANGAEALDLLKLKGPVNLLITDVVMPGMTGRQLATQVQSMDAHCGILYMSGFTADTGVETGQFPPGSYFLQKPFTLGSLLRKANEVLASIPRRPTQ